MILIVPLEILKSKGIVLTIEHDRFGWMCIFRSEDTELSKLGDTLFDGMYRLLQGAHEYGWLSTDVSDWIESPSTV